MLIRMICLCQNWSDVRKYIKNFTEKKFFSKVDEKSMRSFLKELSKEPHIAAGRRDKWVSVTIEEKINRRNPIF